MFRGLRPSLKSKGAHLTWPLGLMEEAASLQKALCFEGGGAECCFPIPPPTPSHCKIRIWCLTLG